MCYYLSSSNRPLLCVFNWALHLQTLFHSRPILKISFKTKIGFVAHFQCLHAIKSSPSSLCGQESPHTLMVPFCSAPTALFIDLYTYAGLLAILQMLCMLILTSYICILRSLCLEPSLSLITCFHCRPYLLYYRSYQYCNC